MELLIRLASIAGVVFASILAVAVVLHAFGKLGRPGRGVSALFCRAPGLDVVVAIFTWVPWVPGLWFGSWPGLLAAFVGQLAALSVWVVGHEWANRDAAAGPRIVKVLNRTVGRWRNHAALWVTVMALPLFWMIRAAQLLVYPMLVVLLQFPRYKQGEWVNCSRQKFSGLVGHDLIWCLYCDWMTGVYSLGAEMLRNVESFWCPIRFYDGKKCENCRVDFPDVDGGWVKADGTMADVEAKMVQMYGSGRREWFGHPARGATVLTVGGQPVSPGGTASAGQPVSATAAASSAAVPEPAAPAEAASPARPTAPPTPGQ
jgi:hypothetical protein